MNADETAIRQVDEIWLFGSVMRREATVGDIDLAVSTSRKQSLEPGGEGWPDDAVDQFNAFGDAPQAMHHPLEMEA